MIIEMSQTVVNEMENGCVEETPQVEDDVESGEITDDEDLNKLEDEDEDVLQLRYEALKSIKVLSEDEKEETRKERKKSKLKKRKRRKKHLKSSKSSSSSSITSLRRIKSHLPSYTTLLTSNYAKQSDNYQVEDMEIDAFAETIIADKDMRARADEPKSMSLMELMIDQQQLNAAPPQAVFYTPNDIYPNKYFEYQSISLVQQQQQRNIKAPNKRKRRVVKAKQVIEVPVNDDCDINELRDNLLNELNQKRSQKVVIDEDVEGETAKKNDQEFDMSHYETTIQLARKQIEEANALTSALQQQQQRQASGNRIMPVIIKINKNDVTSSSSEDDEQVEQSPQISSLTLQTNISMFLDAAKEQAKLEIEKEQTEPSSPTKLSATIKRLKETSRKDEIRIVRDRINTKSKEITECNKKSVEARLLLAKKAKDMSVSKEKIRLLKEQLQVAEKILQANEETVKDLKMKQKTFDFKLVKLKEIKKKQQEHLQALLASNTSDTVAVNQVTKTIQTPKSVINRVLSVPQSPVVDLRTTISKPAVVVERAASPPVATPTSNRIVILEAPAINKMDVNDLERLIESKSTMVNGDLKERIDNLKLKSLNKEPKQQPVTTTTTVSSSSPSTTSIRPKIFVSNQTNKQLHQINIDKFANNLTTKVQDGVVTESSISRNLVELVEGLTKEFPYVPLVFNKDMLALQILTKPHFTDLNEYLATDAAAATPTPMTINNVLTYESPLVMFKGYRFNKNFCEFNSFESAYSKFYCNSIDIRKPFCPFDLNGSCKDSNCIYQHSSVMTMDNLQRTEHFLSYCPDLINVSEALSQKEALKRLRNYAKTFMSSNLNRMSIKDYFKYLYDEIVKKRKISEPSTILTRIPSLITSSNKVIGAYEDQNFDLEKFESDSEHLKSLNRLNRFKYRCMGDALNQYLAENPSDIDGWLYYSSTKSSSNCELALNILSQALETNADSEIVWLEYLDIYSKMKKLKDYNEVCLLAIDNCATYKTFWKILLTINIDYIDEIIGRFNKYLIETSLDSDEKSFYLCELIVYHVYIKLVYNGDLQEAKNLFQKYLKTDEICSNSKLKHSCALWLHLIYLNAFGCLPTLHFHENIPGRLAKISTFLLPWYLHGKFTCDIQTIRQIICEALQMFKTKAFLIDGGKTASRLTQKQILVHALIIYENLISLEVALKRYDVALKLCDRLLVTDSQLIDIWLLKLSISFQTPSTAQQIIDSALSACPIDAHIHLTIAQYYISINKPEDAIVLLEAFVLNYYDFGDVETLYKETLCLIGRQTKLKSHLTDEYLDKQLLDICLCYCLLLTLKSTPPDDVYNFAFKKFKSISERTTLWARYLKYKIGTVEFSFHSIYPYIKKCFQDLSSPATASVVEVNLSQLFIVDCLIKYCRTIKEKSILFKHLLNLTTNNNAELLKWSTNFYSSNNSTSLQCLYDHLVISSVRNDSLWIWCIKMCLDQNNYQQAQSIYKKAELVCENSILLKKLSHHFKE